MNMELTEQEKYIHDMNELQKQIEGERHENEKIYYNAKMELSPEMQKLLEEEIEESEGGSDFKIVNKPYGDKQENDSCEVYIDQTCNGGYSGDSYEGYIYFKLSENKYLKWFYAI